MRIIESIYEEAALADERGDDRYTVAWDLDNTLVDETGWHVRPGAFAALRILREAHVRQVVWTSSTTARALDILRGLGMDRSFDALIGREGYALDEIRKNRRAEYHWIKKEFQGEKEFQARFEYGKNLGVPGYDVLIDDNPKVRGQAAYWDFGYRVEVCEGFTGWTELEFPGDIERLAKKITRLAHPPLLARLGLAV